MGDDVSILRESILQILAGLDQDVQDFDLQPQKWDLEYLCDAVGGEPVTVSVTPDGSADAVKVHQGEEVFALPCQVPMTMREFRHKLLSTRRSGEPCVPSVQFQNSNLTRHFDAVCDDVELDVGWASAAFGCRPDAVNIWLGDKRTTTSFHKDHYENLYAVVKGTKTFTLLPPSSVHRMHLCAYRIFSHHLRADGTFSLALQEPEARTQWCPIDLNEMRADQDAFAARFPRFCEGPAPLTVTVHAGEILYLPAMWFHAVEQDEREDEAVIAVNFWYDMQFDVKFAYFTAVAKLAELAGLNGTLPV